MRVAASIRAPDVNVLVACVDENIAGFAIMRYGDDDAHLDLLAVAPEYRRTASDANFSSGSKNAPSLRAYFSVALEVRAENEGAQLFYKAWAIAPSLTSWLLPRCRGSAPHGPRFVVPSFGLQSSLDNYRDEPLCLWLQRGLEVLLKRT